MCVTHRTSFFLSYITAGDMHDMNACENLFFPSDKYMNMKDFHMDAGSTFLFLVLRLDGATLDRGT